MAATSSPRDCEAEMESDVIEEQIVEIGREEDDIVDETKDSNDEDSAMFEDEEVQPVLIVVKDSSQTGSPERDADSEAEEGRVRKTDELVDSVPDDSVLSNVSVDGSSKRKRGRPKKSKEGLENGKPRKKSRKSGDASEIRRSTRERHVKVYEDFLDDEDDEGDEGDGLTSDQRASLDRRIRAIGTTKTWRKQIRFIYGETAKKKKPYVRRVQAKPVLEIFLDPPRPSQAIIKRFVPLPVLDTAPIEHCKFLFRPQDTFGVDMADKGGCDYTCDRCQFTSSRINNMIRHQVKDCLFNKDFFSWNEDSLFEATSKKKKSTKPKTEEEEPVKEEEEIKAQSPQPGPSTVAETTPQKQPEPQLSSEDEESDGEDQILGERLGIKRHDVVWIKHGHTVYWPGLVLKILNRGLKGKARTNTIQMRVFLIHNGTKLIVQSSKVENFDSPNRNEFLEGGQKQKAALATEHARAAQKADKFLREKVLGVNIDPVRFFCLGETKLIQEHESSSSDDDELPDDNVEGPRWELITPEEISSTENESRAERLAWVKRTKESRKNSNRALVEFITEGKVEAHLVGIYRGTVPSRRHDNYTSEDEDLRQKLKLSSWWGPIDDAAQQEVIYLYCHELVERSKEVEEVKGLDSIKYAFEVFCPEAITKAICKLAMVDMETAAETFEKGAQIVRACKELEQPDSEPVEPEAEAAKPDAENNEAEVDEEPSENLNTGEVVREELERLGVQSDLLKEIDRS